MTTTARVPAGWYPDPLGDAGTTRRWWNGEIWTEYTAPLSFGSPATGASAPRAGEAAGGDEAERMLATTGRIAVGAALAPTAHDSALAALAMTLHAGTPATSPWDVLPSVSAATVFSPATVSVSSSAAGEASAADESTTVRNGEELGRPAPAAHPVIVPATRAHTTAVWIMTAMPVVHLLLIVAMATRYPLDAPGWTIALALVLPFVCSAGLAAVDGRLLGEDGHLRVAPWGLALVAPPLYLLVRAGILGRIRRSAWAPLAVWTAVLATVLSLGALLAPAALTAAVALIV